MNVNLFLYVMIFCIGIIGIIFIKHHINLIKLPITRDELPIKFDRQLINNTELTKAMSLILPQINSNEISSIINSSNLQKEVDNFEKIQNTIQQNRAKEPMGLRMFGDLLTQYFVKFHPNSLP